MLREIIAIWKDHGFMKDVVEKFAEMLGDAEYVFGHAWGSFIGQMVIEEMRQHIYDKDIAINENEREIRRMLAEHLSINPKQDVSGCLVMMSLIKDAERIGDYSKNIFELAVMFEGETKEMKYMDRLSTIQENIFNNFEPLRRAFLESDEDLANEVLKSYPQIKDECKNMLKDLFSDALSVKEAVSTTILSRSFKRINSHICNIASGMVYPMHKIDFVRVREGLLD
ncbi:MAG: phosphate uptake regulator PhoU [bacterium]|nr:MAG: phosphate uptake regulator PhoU [bacterium]